jgi:hypothetical protein
VNIQKRNSETLREAKRTVAMFEKTHGLSTKDMLMCAEGDPRLAEIDGFDLIDWHYALEQIAALRPAAVASVVSSFQASATEQPHHYSFTYACTTFDDLNNSSEPELLLVA